MTVTFDVPAAAVLAAVNVSVLLPAPVTDCGVNAAVTPAGSPLAVSPTAPVKPPVTIIVTVVVAVAPGATVTGVALRSNPGVPAAEEGMAGYAFVTFRANSVAQNVPAGGELGSESVAPPAAGLVLAGLQLGSPVVEVTPL